MKPLLLAVVILGVTGSLAAQTEVAKEDLGFHAAEARLVTDIPAAINCSGWGVVVLDALISTTGEVQQVEVRRGVPCFTELAVQTVKSWTFSPATFAGKAVASRVPVAVTFPPPRSVASPLELPPLAPQSAAAIQAEFQPAEVTRAATLPMFESCIGYRSTHQAPETDHTVLPLGFDGYTVWCGSLVLEVALDEKGEAEDVKVLRALPTYTEGAPAAVADIVKTAVKDWRFIPATFNGHSVPSKIVLTFVSPPVVINNP